MLNVLGGISFQTPFIFVIFTGGKRYVLDSIKSNNKINYFWNEQYKAGEKTIPILTLEEVSGTTGDYSTGYIKDNTNSGYLSVDTDKVTLIRGSKYAFIFESTFTPWQPPTAILSLVEYNFLNNQKEKIKVYSDNQLSQKVEFQVSPLPILWYADCQGTTGNVVNTQFNTLINWTCNIDKNLPECQGVGILSQGFVDPQDCLNNFVYTYCKNPDICGHEACKGPCQTFYYDCDYTNKNFTCKFDYTKFFEEYPWYKNWYFIAGVIALVVIIIAIVVIGIFISRRK